MALSHSKRLRAQLRCPNRPKAQKTSVIRWLTGLFAIAAIAQGAEPQASPNILIVYTDDQRWDSLGIAGHPFLKTPNIDRIGSEGAYFTQSFVTSPLCSPSRASFLSGQYAHTHGVRANGDYTDISMQLQTFPRSLHEAGYRTAYIGKWHMGSNPEPRPGFDHWVSFPGQGRYHDETLNVDGATTPSNGYITDVLTDYALQFLDQDSAQPFCLIVAHKGPHSPSTPAQRHRELYKDERIPWRVNVNDDISDKKALSRPLPGWPKVGAGTGPGADQVRDQLRTLVAIDEGVGRLLAKLEAKGELDQTVIVFTSDHGYFWGEHGLGGKRAAYDEALRVPLLIRYPPLIEEGTVSEALVCNIDIAPTLLSLAGLQPRSQMQGKSLTPLLGSNRALDSSFRKAIFADYLQDQSQPRIPTWRAIRTQFWKYIQYPTLVAANELYKLSHDSGEMENRHDIPEEEYVDIVHELKREMYGIMNTAKHPAQSFKVEGLLIDRWQAQNVSGIEDARQRTRATMLSDGSFKSGFLVLKPDGTKFPLPNTDKDKVLNFLEAEKRPNNLSVKAYLYEDEHELRLIELSPVFDRPHEIAMERDGIIAIEAEHANRSIGYRSIATNSASGGFAVQVDEDIAHSQGDLEFELEIRTAGRWHLWIRTRAMHHRENGMRIMLNGKIISPPPGHPLAGSDNIYIRKNTSHDVWNWDPRWKPNHEQEERGLRHAGPITLDLPAGRHTLTLAKRLRERPLIDKIVLSLSPQMPGGFGPEGQ